MTDHNTGQNKSTRNKGPWKIVFQRPFDTKLEASRFELRLKRLKSKEYIKREFKEFSSGCSTARLERPDRVGEVGRFEMNEMFFTYIVESEKNGMWYYGHSENPQRRMTEHNTGQNKSTRNKGPWKIVFQRPFDTKLEASRFELRLKGLRAKNI